MEFVKVVESDATMSYVRHTSDDNVNWQWYATNGNYRINSDVNGSNVTFTLQKKNTESGETAWAEEPWYLLSKNGQDSYLQIVYTTKLTDTKAAEIATMLQKQYAENSDLVSVTLTNTGKFKSKNEILIDGKPGKVATDTANLTLKQVVKKTAPGLTKAAYTDFKAVRADGTLSGLPIWEIKYLFFR